MIRYYCDSNVYRYIKPQSRNYNQQLHEVMEQLRNKVLFCFSTAHIEDLRFSKKEYHLSDLECLGNYVQDNYFAYHSIEKQFNFYLATPKQVYEEFDFSKENYQYEPFTIEKFLDNTSFDEFSPAIELLNTFLKLPINSFSSMDINPNNDKWINDKFPLGSRTSLKEFMQGMQGMIYDEKEFKEYRKFVGSYYNSDNYNYEKWNLEFNEKFRNTPIQKTFLEFVDMSLNDSQKGDFYWTFSQAYTLLEAMNVTTEKSGGKKKSNSFTSLSVDAQHAYYAAHADFLISDDVGLRTKALILYSLLNIPTKVLSVKDYIARKNIILNQEESSKSFFETFTFELKTSLVTDNSYSFDFNSPFSTFKLSHTYFNYFNKLQVMNYLGENLYSLYLDRGSYYLNNVMYRELDIIIKKLLDTFGLDDGFKGNYRFEEKTGNEEIMRTWTVGYLSLSILISKKLSGSYIILLLKFKNPAGASAPLVP